MSSNSRQQAGWQSRLTEGLLFFVFSLLVLSGLRIFFFWHFRSPEMSLMDFWPGFAMGVRVDAKWLGILMLPAWAAAVLSIRWTRLDPVVKVLSGAALAGAVTADVVNIGFYGFYGTPITSVIFGFFQDDTRAIMKTIASDWPVAAYLGSVIVCTALPFLALKGCGRLAFLKKPRKASLLLDAGMALLGTAALAICIRGSLSTFPLRLQNFSVSPLQFINDTVPNGPAALYDAVKEQRSLDLRRGGPLLGLSMMGFRSPEDAEALLKQCREDHGAAQPARFSAQAPRPHVVFALMESMGRDLFESHDPKTNDMLGALEGVLSEGVVFRKGIAVQGGTFPSLEGLL